MADALIAHKLIPFAPLLAHLWDLIAPKSAYDWLLYDLAWLEKCDCALRLPGQSRGADAEVRRAEELGLPVYYTLADLLESMQ